MQMDALNANGLQQNENNVYIKGISFEGSNIITT
jgi:hypothetical protein